MYLSSITRTHLSDNVDALDAGILPSDGSQPARNNLTNHNDVKLIKFRNYQKRQHQKFFLQIPDWQTIIWNHSTSVTKIDHIVGDLLNAEGCVVLHEDTELFVLKYSKITHIEINKTRTSSSFLRGGLISVNVFIADSNSAYGVGNW